MLDLRRIRAEPEAVKAALARRGNDPSAIDEVLELDREQRSVGEQRDAIRQEISAISKQVGELRRSGAPGEADELTARSRAHGDAERVLAGRADELAVTRRFLTKQRQAYAAHADADHRAWTDLCQMVLASNAFLYVE